MLFSMVNNILLVTDVEVMLPSKMIDNNTSTYKRMSWYVSSELNWTRQRYHEMSAMQGHSSTSNQ